MRYYHALQNDRWIIEDVFHGARDQYFVEAGAMDGRFVSGTYALEKYYGWRGICVEPHAAMYRRLVNRRRCICENVCLGRRAGPVEFIEVSGSRPWQRIGPDSGYSGVAAHLSASKRSHWAGGRPVTKACTTLAALLEKHSAPHDIGYLCLDTEGSEYEVLRDFPFRDYRFRAISVEGSSCDKLLRLNGYRRVENPYSKVDYEHYYLLDGGNARR